jgi:hypothetical protein
LFVDSKVGFLISGEKSNDFALREHPQCALRVNMTGRNPDVN